MAELMKRRGRIRIPTEYVNEHPYLVMDILSKCIVVRCEHIYTENMLDYWAYSWLFDEVPQGEMIPGYEIHVRWYKNRKPEWRFNKSDIQITYKGNYNKQKGD